MSECKNSARASFDDRNAAIADIGEAIADAAMEWSLQRQQNRRTSQAPVCF